MSVDKRSRDNLAAEQAANAAHQAKYAADIAAADQAATDYADSEDQRSFDNGSHGWQPLLGTNTEARG